MSIELPPLPSKSPDWDAIDAYAEAAAERERILLARVAELESALSDAVALYGKPGGPWNVPSDPGGWLERARAAIDAAQGEVLPCGVYVAPSRTQAHVCQIAPCRSVNRGSKRSDSMNATTMLTPNFSRAEMQCKCGCGLVQFAPGFLQALQRLRDTMGVPLPVNSACRCAAHNARVGGHPRSLHVGDKPFRNTGGTCAVDIGFPAGHPHRARLLDAAWSQGWSVGLNDRFVHLDLRTQCARLPQAQFTY